jgi:hypothetical protein
MTFKSPPLNQASPEVLALSYYSPVRTAEHSQDLLSQTIVHIENIGERGLAGAQNASANKSIEFFAKTLTTILSTKTDFMLAMAPPSKAAHHKSDGMKGLIDRTCVLMQESNIKNRALLLQRHSDIESSREGAMRTEVQHRGTLRVNPDYKDEVRGKTVLLLDDVTLTGNTMAACRRKLMEAGASQVICLTLGKSKQEGVSIHPSEKQKLLSQTLLSKGDWPSQVQEGKNADELFQSNLARANLQKVVATSRPQSIFAPIAPGEKRKDAAESDENSAASTPTPQGKKHKTIPQVRGQSPIGGFFQSKATATATDPKPVPLSPSKPNCGRR